MGIENVIGYAAGYAIVGGPLASVVTIAWLAYRKKEWTVGRRIAKIVAWNCLLVFVAAGVGKALIVAPDALSAFALIVSPVITAFAVDAPARMKTP